MDNFSAITLKNRKREMENTQRLLRKSMSMLSDQTSEYAEHHQHVINTLSEMIDAVDRGIKESELIGKGV